VSADLLQVSGINPGTTISLRKCNGTLSFREYNYRKEATETTLFMDVPSKCTNPTNVAMTCTPGTAPSATGNPNVRTNNLPANGQVQGPPTRSAPVSVQVILKKDGQVQTVKP
jgi:hypothetical protein